MLHIELSRTEIEHRRMLTEKMRNMVIRALGIREADNDCILTSYREFFLQISFSEVHPLMVFCLARPLENYDMTSIDACNDMNMNSVLGSHVINEGASVYHYRATHWLECELTKERFFEILNRCTDEAVKGYFHLVT